MITRTSKSLTETEEPCFGLKSALGNKLTCKIMCKANPECGAACPFYKPKSGRDCVRIEDEDGINLIPYEEFRRKRLAGTKGYATWVISRRSR